MCDKSIFAGIVTYNPDIELLKKNIEVIFHQVNKIFIYDNGSKNSKKIEEELNAISNIEICLGKENKGIAYGLNRILEFAIKNNYEWFLTLDQDSICSANLIDEYFNIELDFDRIAMICPFVLNNNKYSLAEYKRLTLPEYSIITQPVDCITSGCLNRTCVISSVGGFCDDLFIDYVDTELNCRILKNNFQIIRANKAYLIQSMGSGKKIKLFSFLFKATKLNLFRKMSVATVYNDLRLYYSSRNSSVIWKLHENAGKRLSPLFMFLLYFYFTITYPLNRSRIKMWSNIICGRKDANTIKLSIENKVGNKI